MRALNIQKHYPNVRSRRCLDLILIIGICLTSPLILSGQAQSSRAASLDNPHATMRTHLYYLQHETYDPHLSAYSIPPTVDPADREQLAIQIKQIFDGKGLYVQMNRIPQDPDFRDSTARASVFTPFPGDLPEIYLEKIDNSWYYSRESIEVVPKIHRRLYPLGADLLSRRIPDSLRGKFLGLELWQYLSLIALLASAWILHLLLTFILRPAVRWLAAHIRNLGYAEPADIIQASRYTSLVFILFIAARVLPVIQLPIRLSQFGIRSIGIIAAILLMLLGLVLIRIGLKRFKAMTHTTDSKMDDQLLPIVRKLLQLAVVGVTIIFILSELNINVTALIAGLSIGALAIALAAQDTVKNLIGSLMIFIDKPFQVGDFVNIDGQEGTIIEVGFRSTRIQLIDTSVVSIPNGNVTNITVLNLGVRQFRLMNILIGVTYGTPPEKIEAFILELRALIGTHPRIHQENALVHFREMGDFSLKIMFRCYLPVFTFPEELEIKEEIYLEIMRIAQRLGIEFAFPSQTIYLDKA